MSDFSTSINILFTIGTILFLFLIYLLFKTITKRRGDRLKKWLYVVAYFFYFVLFVGATLFLFWVWKFDYNTYLVSLSDSIATILKDSLVKIISTILVFFLTFLVLKITKITIENIGKKPGFTYRRRRTLANLTLSVSRYLGWIIALLIVLAIWGINIGPALAGLGILGLVIGLGAQKFINDLISGLFIIFEQHYDVGDIIETNGFKGEVIDIGLKTTRIKNWKGEVKILSNGSISDTINYSRNPSLAIVDFSIAYAEDVEKTIALLKKELPKFSKSYPEIIEDPEILGVVELAGSSVNIRVIARTQMNQHFNIERQLRAFIKATLDKHNIEIPFPQIVVHEAKPKQKKQTTPLTNTSKSQTVNNPALQKTTTPEKLAAEKTAQVVKKKTNSTAKKPIKK